MFKKIKVWTSNLKKQVYVLYFANKDNRVPWYAKLFVACLVAYAFSPIDLIPDFIPILGYIDDVIIVPLGIIFALKMIPDSVITDCEKMAEELIKKGKPKNWIVGSIIILVWGFVLIWSSIKIYFFFN